MMHHVEKGLAILALTTLAFVAEPCEAFADDDWSMTIYQQYGGHIGGAPGAATGLDSRAGIGLGLGTQFTQRESGWGFGLGFSWAFDLHGDQSPGFFQFTFEPTLAKRVRFLETEVLTLTLGPSLGMSEASYDSNCPHDCTPEEDAVGAVFDAHDSFVFGGVATIAIDHVFDGDEDGLFGGIALQGRGLWAVADDASPARWSGAVMLRFGGHFDL